MDDLEFTLFEGDMEHLTVYAGFFDDLKIIPHGNLFFREGKGDCMKFKSITLGEIYAQCKHISKFLTVFYISALKTEVYQIGNYEEREWESMGTLRGFA